MFSYIAYGLSVHSELVLPELLENETTAVADVIIRLEKIDNLPDNPVRVSYISLDNETICIRSKDVGVFLVKNGREIIIDPSVGSTEDWLRLFILGPALTLLLHQRGLLVLHASAVSMNGGAIIFLGHKGFGKSTTAGALYASGHRVVADDIVAIQTSDNNHLTVFPAFPILKLWPEAINALGEVPETFPRLHSGIDKRAHPVKEGFSPLELPLKRIYVLAEGESHEIKPLPAQQSVIELLRHSYAVRLIKSIGDSAHFLRCANLVKNQPVYQLRRPRSLPNLSEVATMVRLHDVQSIDG